MDLSVSTGLVAACLVATLGGACSSGYTYPVNESLVASPVDGTTGLTTLEVDLGISIEPAPAPDLALVKTTPRLVTWPDGTPLSTFVTAVPASATFAVTPLTPAAPGWYAVLLPAVPKTLQLPPESFHLLPDGRPAVRVRVGSAAVLWGLDVCPKDGVTTQVLVTFSEEVHAATTSTSPLSVTAGSPGAPVACTSNEVPIVDRPLQQYSYLCPAVADTDVVTISVTEGLLSHDGGSVPVGDRAVTFGSLPANGVTWGCSSLKIDP